MKLLLQPLPIRIFHWIMFFCVMILLFTGLYLHQPFAALQLPVRSVRLVHSLTGIVLFFNLLGHSYYYIVSKRYREILFLPREIQNIRSFARYVLFIAESHPNYGRYNPGQKLLFSSWGLVVLLAAATGWGLWFPDDTELIQRWLGGINHIRMLHYLAAVFFMMSVPLHLYLVFTEDPAHLQAMFSGYIEKDPNPVCVSGRRKKAGEVGKKRLYRYWPDR